ncbi:Organic hydroperoxide resistance transcriptional regulator [Rhodococcus sp. B50]|nr:Organic hydroperoxide resistance transcriptional regulator [Rhodococcus sp. B50]
MCFALAVANRAVLAIYRPILDRLGLTHPQYLVMLALWEESPLTSKQVGQLLQLDSPTLSPLLKRLETLGLITRARSAADERQLVLELTDAGRALRAEAESVPGQVVDALGVEVDELQDLHAALVRVNAAALKAGAL